MVRIGPPRTPVLVQQHGVQVCTLGQRFMIANPTWIRMRWQRERFMCRCKVRMSGLCKVEMSAFMDGRGPHGNGANHFEPTRTGPIKGVARGTAEAADAGGSRRATENKRPPRAADVAAPARARRSLPGSRTARSTIESQAGDPLGAEDSGTPAPALCGFRTHTGC